MTTTKELKQAPTQDMYGFFGTVETVHGADYATKAWDTAWTMLTGKGMGEIATRNLLRSKVGRWFADEIAYSEGTIQQGLMTVINKKWAKKQIKEFQKTQNKELYQDDEQN